MDSKKTGHGCINEEDCEVGLDGSKEKGQSSTNPSYDSPGATEVGVQALDRKKKRERKREKDFIILTIQHLCYI